MLTKENIIEKLREKFPYLSSEYGIRKIGIFGSYAKDEQTEASDIDIVTEFEKPIGLRFIELSEYLEQLLGKKTELLTPEGIKMIEIKEISENIQKSIIYV